MRPAALLFACPLALALGACATMDGVSEPRMARATLRTADGREVGLATIVSSPAGLTVTVAAAGLEPGPKGVHVHQTGACTPDFAAAGGHWNPGGATHGLAGAAGQHAGDMPNLEVGGDGAGTLTYTLDASATFEGLLDADGSAFVIHAGADDQMTDPSGNSGARLACGVFAGV